MIKKLTIAMAQINVTVGDLVGNRHKILAAHKEAHSKNVDLVVFSEMAVTGYPPEDLVLRPDFQDKATAVIRELATHTKNGTAILVGGLWRETGGHIYNAAVLLDEGKIQHITCKHNLPNYGVFDEKRVFLPAPMPEPIEFRGIQLGVLICEDMWSPESAVHLYEKGAEFLISINASPFEEDKHQRRMAIAQACSESNALPLLYVNQLGGQDELVFDGGSFILDINGQLVLQQPMWKESLALTKWQKKGEGWQCTSAPASAPLPSRLSNIYNAMRLGLKDYVEKNGFPGVVIGMSGGIDSALTAAVAVDALGAKRVRLIMMPSKYTSEASMRDAKECAALLGLEMETIGIEKGMYAFEMMLHKTFEGHSPDTTEENIQSRLRGVILMAISNKFGSMVLTTGNKSEMAVGYATLYGDMCGGFNVLKDIYKTDVYELAKWRNEQEMVIPLTIMTKPPTAELRPDQKDEDSLPPYEILDDILVRLIEKRHSVKQIIEYGHAPDIVKYVARLVKLSEYKRRQSPPGVKISGLAFGKDRRYPITNGFNF